AGPIVFSACGPWAAKRATGTSTAADVLTAAVLAAAGSDSAVVDVFVPESSPESGTANSPTSPPQATATPTIPTNTMRRPRVIEPPTSFTSPETTTARLTITEHRQRRVEGRVPAKPKRGMPRHFSTRRG